MNIFETVKASVSVKRAAEYYGMKVSRNSMVCCPFHLDRHPSMKLNEDFYYCFGCGVTGDVIDLTAKLFDIGKYKAARKLAADFGIDPDNPPAAPAVVAPRYRLVKAFREDERYCHNVLCTYLHLLETWEREYAPVSPEEPLDERFVEACQMKSRIEYMADILTVGDLETRVRVAGMLLKDGTINDLADRLNRLAEEEKAA